MRQDTIIPIHSSRAGIKEPPPLSGLEALRRILRPAVS